jgi:hypothetical protein
MATSSAMPEQNGYRLIKVAHLYISVVLLIAGYGAQWAILLQRVADDRVRIEKLEAIQDVRHEKEEDFEKDMGERMARIEVTQAEILVGIKLIPQVNK